MGSTRAILHSDMNCFYASVEMMLDPALREKAVAVCGSTESRHGIVLAKSEKAKKYGAKTGMVNWEAKQKCPSLIVVPPHYEQYLKYAALAREIYYRYTDLVEPYGMDECWLDCTNSQAAFGNGMEIAEKIRLSVKEELGLTVSIGVSFNKTFAKLGSDMKKPDAITEITRENFQQMVWSLPASDLLYVGRSTARKLESVGIYTIGDIAVLQPQLMKSWLGANGELIWMFATGNDVSRVAHKDFVSPVKSVGHGITCITDLKNEEEIWKVMLDLTQDIGHKLRLYELLADGVQIAVKNNDLYYRQYQAQFRMPTRSPLALAEKARALFHKHYEWEKPVRAITVRAINLMSNKKAQQVDLFTNMAQVEKRDKIEGAVEDIRRRFGKRAILPVSLMGDLKMPVHRDIELRMPGLMNG